MSGPGDPAAARKRSATLTDGRPNRHDDGGMRTWSLSLARGAAVAALSATLLAAPAGAQMSSEKLENIRARAEQGDASAQFNLGNMHANDEGVPQDYSEAMRWYRLAAEQGDAGAQFILGVMYADGEGVPQDYVQAHKWFNLAAASAEVASREAYVEARDDVAARMTPSQIAEAQRLAREWRPD